MVDDVLLETSDKMAKAVGHTQSDFGSVRTGRATPALVEKLKVDYYGAEVPLQQLAGFNVPEPRMLVVSPYDKNSMKAIEKAIQQSDLGITPSNDGQVIRLVFPQLTTDRRKELVKVVKHKAEEGRVAVRNLRRAARRTARMAMRASSALCLTTFTISLRRSSVRGGNTRRITWPSLPGLIPRSDCWIAFSMAFMAPLS